MQGLGALPPTDVEGHLAVAERVPDASGTGPDACDSATTAIQNGKQSR